MKIIVAADIHGDLKSLGRFVDSVGRENADLLVCPGDFTDMFSTPKEFSQFDIANLIMQKLLSLKIPTVCVPGNHDPFEILELFDEYGVNIHEKEASVAGIKTIGWGGAPTPFDTMFEPSEDETSEALERLGKNVLPGKFLLVTHDPPKGSSVDRISSGEHVGSTVIRRFIEKKQPLLAISAHIHESPGTDRINKTTLFYPGPIFEGKYGTVIIGDGDPKCDIRSF